MKFLKKIFGNHPIIQMESEKTPLAYYEMGNALRKVLYRYLDTKFEEWYSTTYIPFKISDIVILDKYNLNKSSNSWDGGPQILIGNGLEPFKLEITDIFGDTSLSYEIVDRYLNTIDYTNFINTSGEVKENNITLGFEKYIIKNTKKPFGVETDNRYGFYVSCRYKSVDDTEVVCYTSGLNIRSFILSETEAANITVQLWEQEYELYLSEQKVNELHKEIENKKKGLDELVQRTVGVYGK
jgi:hypothetical protein